MYVPPDEPIQESGEINIAYDNERNMMASQVPPPSQQMTNASARYEEGGVISAINPIYQR